MSSKELYIGNLDPDSKSQEIRDIFEQYGVLNRCEVKCGISAHSAAFGFVAFESRKDAERAQRKEHGRSHRGRRLIVEFSKTTPGQNGRRSRYTDGDERMRNSNGRSHSRSHDHGKLKTRVQRRCSPFYGEKSFKDRSRSNDRHRKRNHSSSSQDQNSGSKRHRSSSNDDKFRSSYARKNEK